MSDLGPICRNCRNTGEAWYGGPCPCSYGKALVQFLAAKKERDEAARAQLPMCERCGSVRATTSLTFTYRDEPYAEHFYCASCCDVMWDEGVKAVDERAAKLKAAGL